MLEEPYMVLKTYVTDPWAKKLDTFLFSFFLSYVYRRIIDIDIDKTFTRN